MARKIVSRAIEAAGGAAKLARELGITTQAISQWRRVPVDRVSEVERVTGIPREELRPDVFGRRLHQSQPQGEASA